MSNPSSIISSGSSKSLSLLSGTGNCSRMTRPHRSWSRAACCRSSSTASCPLDLSCSPKASILARSASSCVWIEAISSSSALVSTASAARASAAARAAAAEPPPAPCSSSDGRRASPAAAGGWYRSWKASLSRWPIEPRRGSCGGSFGGGSSGAASASPSTSAAGAGSGGGGAFFGAMGGLPGVAAWPSGWRGRGGASYPSPHAVSP
mmetsp:Transcript_86598/g.245155  ORF Transcript_86598/g.245155 Transcript_86598/m.245155 type:complete len:207 (+) Transcript_86598:6403-7023(+)